VDPSVGRQPATRRGGQAQATRQARVEALAFETQVVAEADVKFEQQRYIERRRRVLCAARPPDNEHVAGELTDAGGLVLDSPLRNVQVSAHGDLALLEGQHAVAADRELEVRAIDRAELLGGPGHASLRRDVGAAFALRARQRSLGDEAAITA